MGEVDRPHFGAAASQLRPASQTLPAPLTTEIPPVTSLGAIITKAILDVIEARVAEREANAAAHLRELRAALESGKHRRRA